MTTNGEGEGDVAVAMTEVYLVLLDLERGNIGGESKGDGN